MMINSGFLSLAFRNVFRNRARSVITLLVISSGCISMILARGFLDDDVHQMREISIRDSLGHLRIYQKGYFDQGLLHPFDYLISNPDDLEKQLAAIPHVKFASPRLDVAGIVSNGDTSLTFLGQAIDPAKEVSLRNTCLMTQGAFLKPGAPYDVMLGKGLAKALRAKPGDALVLVATTRTGSINASDVKVVGVFSTIDKAFDDHAIRMPLTLAHALLRTQGVEAVLVFLDKTEAAASVKQQMQVLFERLHLPYEVKTWDELEEAEDIRKLAGVWQSMFRVFKMIILVGLFLGIVNTMNMVVLERVGEIGTLLALGMKRSGVAILFMLEGAILGLLGALMGCLVGSGLALLISKVGIPMPPPPGSNLPWVARIALSPGIFVLPFILSVVTALVSSIFPALKAARLEIAEALRHNV